ncbi:hypothetical protein HOK00_10515 [bacterium]|jgi:guanylate kinase|nr:hypothetical protein [bacterium]
MYKNKTNFINSVIDSEILLIIGSSGSGKDYLTEEITKGEEYILTVSDTSRAMREGEKEGVNYYYMSTQEIIEKEANNEMAEMIKIRDKETGEVKVCYGISKKEIEDKLKTGKKLVFIVEPHGAEQIMKYFNEKKLKTSLLFLDISFKERKEAIIKTEIKNGRTIKEATEIAEERLARMEFEDMEPQIQKIIKNNPDLNSFKSEKYSLNTELMKAFKKGEKIKEELGKEKQTNLNYKI